MLVIIVVAVLVGLIVAASMAGSPSHSASGSGKIYTATITADVGISTIRITNLNVPAAITIQMTEMPFQFNFTDSDVLSFNATVQKGFKFNVWWNINEGTFHNNNPYTFKATRSFNLEARTITLEAWQGEP